MDNNTHTCTMCGATFENEADLDRHNKEEHGDDETMNQ